MLPRRFLLLLCMPGALWGCEHKRRGASQLPARTYRMGFSWFPPQPDVGLALTVIDAFAPRADDGLILVSPPWTQLLAGADPAALVAANELGLANHYRGLGKGVVVSIDPTNGLDRSADAPELTGAGRSIAEPAVQALFVAYAVQMAVQLQPERMSVASETNLVRREAASAIYDGLRVAASAAAAAIASAAPDVAPFITVQTEVAWGLPGGTFVGIATDLADFPFTEAIGVSSFPFLAGIADPAELPDDWYSRLRVGNGLPLLAIEGGWPSVPVASAVASDPAMQARFIARQEQLLDEAAAVGWFQITFTDLDVAAYPPGVAPFANLGLVTASLAAKPALTEWTAAFARPR